jgi:hypothetical protein
VLRHVAIAAACAATLAGPAVMAAAAQAYDHYPCGPRTTNRQGQLVQYCPLTQAGVPVFNGWDYRSLQEARDANGIVGWLTYGGCANWFYDQFRTPYTYWHNGYANDWWAYTKADNGAYGYVSQVYFKGGLNWERDRGLKVLWDGWAWYPAPYCGARVG